MLIKINSNLFINTGLMKSIINRDNSYFAIQFSDNTSEQITQEEHEKLLTFLRHHELSAGAEVNGQ
jgi:hypothetical protein